VNMGPNKKPPKKRRKRRQPDPGGPDKKPPKKKKPPKGKGSPPPRGGGPAPAAGQQDVLVVPDSTQQISQMPTDYPDDASVYSSGEGTPPQYHYHREASPGQVYIAQQSEPASGPGQAGQTG
jgi:hypothetical protein